MSGKGWWNSAISGLESRLDTILTEEQSNAAKAKGTDAAGKHDVPKMLAVEPGGLNNRGECNLVKANSRSIAQLLPKQAELETARSTCEGCE